MKRPLSDRDIARLAGIGPEPAPSPTLGVVGRYRLVREIGRGAMGIVYEAEDTELRRRVAVKMTGESAQLTGTAMKRFQREAQAAASLSHPNVVTVYEFGEVGGRMFLAMELLTGRSLDQVWGDRSVDLRQRVALVEGAARGVAAVHERGIVHRDLKPENIFVTADGRPKVGDFGLAHWNDPDMRLTRSGMAIGTPMYMAPEQVRGDLKLLSTRTDVYALGAILYEAVCGVAPFIGRTVPEIYGRIINAAPTPPRRRNIRIPADLEAIILKALEKDPQRRYESAGRFADDLRRHLDGLPVEARRFTVIERTVRHVRRNLLVWGLAAVALAAIAGLAGALATRSPNAPRPAATPPVPPDLFAAIYAELVESRGAMEALEDAWYQGRPAGTHSPRFREIEETVRRVQARHPTSSSPGAWLGLAKAFAGSIREGLAEMESASAKAGDDPVPDLLLARWHLAGVVRATPVPTVELVNWELKVGELKAADPATGDLALQRALSRPGAARFDAARTFKAFSAALTRLQGGDLEGAADGFTEAAAHSLLKYEAAWLRGVALYRLDRLEAAAQSYDEAAGRGWAPVLSAASVTRLKQVSLTARRSAETQAILLRAIKDLEQAATAGAAESWRLLSIALTFASGDATAQGLPGGDHRRRAWETADRYVELMKGSDEARRWLANTGYMLGMNANEQGEDPAPWYQRACDSLTAMAAGASLEAQDEAFLALCLLQKGQAEAARGRDPVASLTGAIDRYRALGRAGRSGFEMNLANALRDRAMHAMRKGGDPVADLEEAIAIYDRLIAVSKSFPPTLSNRGLTWFYIGEHQLRRGGDWESAMDRALADLRETIRLDPAAPLYRTQILRILLVWADAESGRGRDPVAWLEEAERMATDGMAGIKSGALSSLRGHARMRLAEMKLVRGQDASAFFAGAASDFAEAVQLTGFWTDAMHLGRVHEATGQAAEAVTAYRKALSLKPSADNVRWLEERIAALERQ